MVNFASWKGAGVVELARLESVCARKGTVGSNPTLSAVKIEKPWQNWLSRFFYFIVYIYLYTVFLFNNNIKS